MKKNVTLAVLLLTLCFRSSAQSTVHKSDTLTARQAESIVKSYKSKGQWPYSQTMVFKDGTVKVSNDGENWFKLDMARYTKEHP